MILGKQSRVLKTLPKFVNSKYAKRLISSIMKSIYPPEDFVEKANVKDPAIYSKAKENWIDYWESFARELHWFEPWEKFFDDSKAPYYRFFVSGKINASYNCVDRHLKKKRNKAAIIWEGEKGENRVLTYFDLYREVGKLSNALKNLGVKKGDKIGIYMPNLPEAVISMLAAARIGATHVFIFAGFSPKSAAFRMKDSGVKLLITADGYYRRGRLINLKEKADEALEEYKGVENVVVVKRAGNEIDMKEGRDHDYAELVRKEKAKSECEITDANDPLFIIYTSGSVAEPKGIIHSTGGYLVHVYATSKIVLDLKDEDVLFCTADLGWITGHSYSVYGPLSLGATVLLYEGAPDYPNICRTFELIEKYGVTVFYTVPTLVRMLQGCGNIDSFDLSTLRLIGSVGEPLEAENWLWLYEEVGKKRCPIVDTWWQTETGGIVISPIPALTPMKPGSVSKPLPGIEVDIYDSGGKKAKPYQLGHLVIKKMFPGFMLGIHGDPKAYVQLYWSKFGKRVYLTGDYAYFDEDGYIWISGRADDVINISGHRVSLVEIEKVVKELREVADCAAIGVPDRIKGTAIALFVVAEKSDDVAEKIKKKIEEDIGRIALPRLIVFVKELPKTAGKVFKRAIADAVIKKEISGIASNVEVVKRIAEKIDKNSSGVFFID